MKYMFWLTVVGSFLSQFYFYFVHSNIESISFGMGLLLANYLLLTIIISSELMKHANYIFADLSGLSLGRYFGGKEISRHQVLGGLLLGSAAHTILMLVTIALATFDGIWWISISLLLPSFIGFCLGFVYLTKKL